jgi:hypothetical protein
MADASVLAGYVSDYVAAVGGLGTAAYGLVDATKVLKKGGVSHSGFTYIEGVIRKLLGPEGGAGGAPCFGRIDMIETLLANWINGVDIVQQKAAAKALIRLYLDPATAPQLAQATGLPAASLAGIAAKVQAGTALDTTEQNILGRFDALVSAALDEGYERADQKYRNSAKVLAGAIAIVLALIGGWIAGANLVVAFLLGVVAVPLAPVVKDLSSALQTAVKALAR